MNRADANNLIDKFETAAIDLDTHGAIPPTLADPEAQTAINRACRLRRDAYNRTRNRLRKALEAGQSS